MKLLKFLGALLFLAVSISLVLNRVWPGKNMEAPHKGGSALFVDLNQFSSSMDEKGIQQFLPDLGLKCTNTEPGFTLGNRVCHANLGSFNDVGTKQIVFFFKEGHLANFKIDVPWQNHQAMIDLLYKDYDSPKGIQKKAHLGVRLVGWKIRGGNLLYDLNKDQDAPWNTLLWISHEEAEVRGGIFIQKK
ncbi:MAG: hypothetical protein LBQ62_06450 [Candidatus Accumulibacter sp.]|jgi:hypothetical protein|nr:hypothetical protein [Accumulibacter sp.]